MREASIKCRTRCHFAFQDTRFLKRDKAGKPRLKARQQSCAKSFAGRRLKLPQPENGIARIG